MKTTKFLFFMLGLILTTSLTLTSCEKDNQEEIPLQNLDNTEITPDTKISSKAGSIVNEKVYRYFKGGSSSLHTYRTQSGAGVAVGRDEGIAYVTPVSSSSNFDRNTYNVLYSLLHPQQKDFVMTTSATEFWNLHRRGWKNVTGKYVLVRKGPGNGTRKLYRFFNAATSDHLYTKNFHEGANAGFKYEGVVGWVN